MERENTIYYSLGDVMNDSNCKKENEGCLPESNTNGLPLPFKRNENIDIQINVEKSGGNIVASGLSGGALTYVNDGEGKSKSSPKPDLNEEEGRSFNAEETNDSQNQLSNNENGLTNTITGEMPVKSIKSEKNVPSCDIDDKLDIDTLVDVYWSFFQLHSKQRMKVLDLAIKAQLGLFAAYYALGDQINKLKIMCAIAISVVGFLCFCLDKRTTDLIHYSRVVFRKIEKEYLANRPEEMKLFTSIKNMEGRITYSLIIRTAYILLFIAGIILFFSAIKEYKTISNNFSIGTFSRSISQMLSEIK